MRRILSSTQTRSISNVLTTDRRTTIYPRNGNDWTARFAPIAKEVELLPARTAFIDGEAMAIDRRALPDFHKLRCQLGQATAGSSTSFRPAVARRGRSAGHWH
jgi:ATP-dependent DNA ligase